MLNLLRRSSEGGTWLKVTSNCSDAHLVTLLTLLFPHNLIGDSDDLVRDTSLDVDSFCITDHDATQTPNLPSVKDSGLQKVKSVGKKRKSSITDLPPRPPGPPPSWAIKSLPEVTADKWIAHQSCRMWQPGLAVTLRRFLYNPAVFAIEIRHLRSNWAARSNWTINAHKVFTVSWVLFWRCTESGTYWVIRRCSHTASTRMVVLSMTR